MTVPLKLAALEMVWPLIPPLVVIVPMLTRSPELSMRWVPPVAPVLIPVVPSRLVPCRVPASVTFPALSTLNSEVEFFCRSMKLPLNEPEPLARLSKIAVPV